MTTNESNGGGGPRLMGQTGVLKGKAHPLAVGTLIIGSGAGAGLLLQDPVVSAQHASITRGHDGMCRIRDLGSKNGTRVNDRQLGPDDEPVLRPGDHVFVAYYGFVYQEGAAGRPAVLLTRLAVLGLLLVVLAVGLVRLVSWVRRTPDQPVVAALSRDPLDRAALREAEAQLGKLVRNDKDWTRAHPDRLGELRKSVETLKTWTDIRADIDREGWDTAREKFASLDLREGSWKATPRIQSQLEVAQRLNRILEAYLEVLPLDQRPDAGREEISRAHGQLLKALGAARADEEAAGRRLVSAARSQAEMLAHRAELLNQYYFIEKLDKLALNATESRIVFQDVRSDLKSLGDDLKRGNQEDPRVKNDLKDLQDMEAAVSALQDAWTNWLASGRLPISDEGRSRHPALDRQWKRLGELAKPGEAPRAP